MKIVVIGSGNLATHLAMALKNSDNDIIQVFSRNICNAEQLARKIGCEAIDNINKVSSDAEIYLICVKDDAIRDTAEALCRKHHNAILIHSAGSVPLNIFEGLTEHYGVIWPIQSFTKTMEVDFRRIPCCLEASDNNTLETIKRLAEGLTETIRIVDSKKRKKLHLAAVFANNLTNHCYRLAERITQGEGMDFSLLLPIIEETAHKVSVMSPKEAQTGPMVRYDKKVMADQLNQITDDCTKDIYRLMARSIHSDQ